MNGLPALNEHGSFPYGGFAQRHPGTRAMTPPQSTSPDAPRTAPRRRPRAQGAHARDHFLDPAHTTSQRRYARQHGLPRATLGDWLRRTAPDGLDPDSVTFFRSAAGERFLRRLLLALLLVAHHRHAV